jgi:hypothetical protein
MKIVNERLIIKKGSDSTPIFKLRGRYSNDPMDLTGVFNITVELTKANRSKLVIDMTELPSQKAYFEEGSVKIIADYAGAIGNSIVLAFNDVDDLDTVIGTWNTANPSNTVSHNGVGDEIYNGNKRLWGGLDAYTPIEVDGNPILGRVKIRLLDTDTQLLKRGDNQSVKVIIDFGAPPSGDRKIAIFDDRLDVVDR